MDPDNCPSLPGVCAQIRLPVCTLAHQRIGAGCIRQPDRGEIAGQDTPERKSVAPSFALPDWQPLSAEPVLHPESTRRHVPRRCCSYQVAPRIWGNTLPAAPLSPRVGWLAAPRTRFLPFARVGHFEKRKCSKRLWRSCQRAASYNANKSVKPISRMASVFNEPCKLILLFVGQINGSPNSKWLYTLGF